MREGKYLLSDQITLHLFQPHQADQMFDPQTGSSSVNIWTGGLVLDQLVPVGCCYGPHFSDPFRACSIDRARRAAARHSSPTIHVRGARISSIARDEPYEGLFVSRVHAHKGEGMQAHLLIMRNAHWACLCLT